MKQSFARFTRQDPRMDARVFRPHQIWWWRNGRAILLGIVIGLMVIGGLLWTAVAGAEPSRPPKGLPARPATVVNEDPPSGDPWLGLRIEVWPCGVAITPPGDPNFDVWYAQDGGWVYVMRFFVDPWERREFDLRSWQGYKPWLDATVAIVTLARDRGRWVPRWRNDVEVPACEALPTATPTETPSVTPTVTASPSSTRTETPAPTATATPSATSTPSPTTTLLPTVTPTATETQVATGTLTLTPSETPAPTVTPTATVTPSETLAPTVTPTAAGVTRTPRPPTPTWTPRPPTPTSTPRPPTPTGTPPTETPVPPTETPAPKPPTGHVFGWKNIGGTALCVPDGDLPSETRVRAGSEDKNEVWASSAIEACTFNFVLETPILVDPAQNRWVGEHCFWLDEPENPLWTPDDRVICLEVHSWEENGPIIFYNWPKPPEILPITGGGN